MKRLLIVLLVLVCSCSFAQMRGGAQYDPDAARNNLSNVSGAASLDLSQRIRAAWAEITGNIYASGSARLEAGTAAAPAYSFAADPDTGIYSAGADNLNLTIGGVAHSYAWASGEYKLLTTTTADGSDNHCLWLGHVGETRGARILAYGNDHPSYSGVLELSCGNDGFTRFLGNSGAESMRIIASTSNVLIGTSTDDGANKLQVNGFTKLGEAATGIKMKVLTGTTAAAEGGLATAAHELTGDKILDARVKVVTVANNGLFDNYTDAAGYQFSVSHDATNVNVILHATNSENILSKPFTVLIWYKE